MGASMDKTLAALSLLIAIAIAAGKPPAAAPAASQAKPCIGTEIAKYAKQHGIDPKIVHSIITVESSWDYKAKGAAGELGLMQLMPATAKAMQVKDRLDPVENVKGGIRFLAYCKQKTGKAYIRCYNAGEKGIHLSQAYAYERKVLDKAKG